MIIHNIDASRTATAAGKSYGKDLSFSDVTHNIHTAITPVVVIYFNNKIFWRGCVIKTRTTDLQNLYYLYVSGHVSDRRIIRDRGRIISLAWACTPVERFLLITLSAIQHGFPHVSDRSFFVDIILYAYETSCPRQPRHILTTVW